MEQSSLIPAAPVHTFECMLQIVPQLRDSCTSIQAQKEARAQYILPGVKALRLVSKHCKQAMQGEVHGYTLQLRSEFILSLRTPCTAVKPLSAWNFLHGAQLCRLAVQLQDEETRPCNPVYIPEGEVSHHTAQLRCFINTVGPATLRDVQSLHLSAKRSDLTGQPNVKLLDFAAVAQLLAEACPNLTRLVTEGFHPAATLAIFGPLCPNIHSYVLSGNELEWMTEPRSIDGIFVLLHGFPRLSYLCTVSRHHLLHASQWLALPSTLRELHCHDLPASLHKSVSQGLSLPALRKLHTHQPLQRWNVHKLSKFLNVVPELRTLTSESIHPSVCNGSRESDSIIVGCNITPTCLWALMNISLRLDSGLLMPHLALACGSDPVSNPNDPDSAEQMPLEYLFCKMPVFPSFVHCKLRSGDVPLAASCLSQLARVIPNVTTLVLAGSGFTDAHLGDLASCAHLQRLDLDGTCLLTAAGLIQCIASTARLDFVWSIYGTDIRTAKLQKLMASAIEAGEDALCVASPFVRGEWSLISKSESYCQDIQWVKVMARMSLGVANV